jgi:hypothetical protein
MDSTQIEVPKELAAQWALRPRPSTRLELSVEIAALRAAWKGGDFVARQSAAINVSERTVQMYLRIGEHIGPKTQEALRASGLCDNLVGLYALAGLTEPMQLKAISLVASGEQRDLQSSVAWIAEKQPKPRQTGTSGSDVDGVRMLVADPFGVTLPAGQQQRSPVIRQVAWTSPAALFLWSTDLVDGLRTASKWGFRVVDSMAWITARDGEIPRSAGSLSTPRHRTLLLCVDGSVPPPRVIPPSVVTPRDDPFNASALLMDTMWPDWAPAAQLRPRPPKDRT